jgi:hypothetical protein
LRYDNNGFADLSEMADAVNPMFWHPELLAQWNCRAMVSSMCCFVRRL